MDMYENNCKYKNLVIISFNLHFSFKYCLYKNYKQTSILIIYFRFQILNKYNIKIEI